MSEARLINLTLGDAHTRTVDHLMQDLRARLQALREDNDSGDADVTAKRRGRISEVKDWLALLEQAQLRARID